MWGAKGCFHYPSNFDRNYFCKEINSATSKNSVTSQYTPYYDKNTASNSVKEKHTWFLLNRDANFSEKEIILNHLAYLRKQNFKEGYFLATSHKVLSFPLQGTLVDVKNRLGFYSSKRRTVMWALQFSAIQWKSEMICGLVNKVDSLTECQHFSPSSVFESQPEIAPAYKIAEELSQLQASFCLLKSRVGDQFWPSSLTSQRNEREK